MKLFVEESSWSGWTENYKPEIVNHEFEVVQGKTYNVGSIKLMGAKDKDWREEPKLAFSIKKIKNNQIVIRTDRKMCNEYISFNQIEDKFEIKIGQALKLITPTKDQGNIFTFTLQSEEDKVAQNIYDNKKFYDDYIAMRETGVNANELLEIPVMKELLPNLKGKTVLDLGCGYGELSRYFVELGAKQVVACDISQNMINLAREKNNHPNIEYKILSMENLSSLEGKFDVIFSSLAFHYIEDYNKLIKDINAHLKKKGILLFSQEHPLATAPTISDSKKNKIDIDGKRFFLISDYNVETKRDLDWNVSGVIKYHRNFKTTINTLINNGFELICIDESSARPEAVKKVEKYIYQNDRPYFLFVKAMKK